MKIIGPAVSRIVYFLATLFVLILTMSCASMQPAGGPAAPGTTETDGIGTADPAVGSIQPGDATATDETGAAAASTSTTVRPRRTLASVTNPKRLLVVDGALSLLGREVLVVNGVTFPNDCTGLVRAAYWYAGIDLAKDFSKYSGNGVARINKTLEAGGLLYETETPLPGDIIFWDNSYDRNEDGKWNDPLTHTGVVVAVSDKGQIEYAHANYRKGIIIEYMNLADPDTNTKNLGGKLAFINSAMRMRGQIVNELWLSSHLLREFGKGYFLK